MVDVVVVGAGPVGLYTGYYCGLRKLTTVIVDSLDTIGGQLSNLYPEKDIYDLPGFKSISADEFIDKLEDQIKLMENYVSLSLNFHVEKIEKTEEGFKLLSQNKVMEAKTIILAMGNGSFEPRKMNLPGEEECENIKYYVHKKEDYVDKNVVVLGGGDSAIDWALSLEPIAKSVTLVHRRDEFRAKLGIVDNLYHSNVKVLTPYVPSEIVGQDHRADTLFITQVKTKAMASLDVDEIIVCYGNIPSSQALDQWGLELVNNKIVINQQSKTNIPGIFACGDVCGYEGREIQIITGLAEGIAASASANRYIHGEHQRRPVR